MVIKELAKITHISDDQITSFCIISCIQAKALLLANGKYLI